MFEKLVATVPLAGPSACLDIAGAALWIASDEVARGTGVETDIDDGRCIS